MALTKVKGHIVADDIALGGNPTTTTQSASDNSTKLATTAYVTTAVSNLVDGAPSTLNTLNEIAAALNDDAALNTTLTNSIATKLPLAGGTLTGDIRVGTADAANRTITVSGGATGNDEGGEIRLDMAADHDGTYDFWRLDVNQDDFRIGRTGTTDLLLDGSGKVAIGVTSPDTQLHVNGTIPIRVGPTSGPFADFKPAQLFASAAYHFASGNNTFFHFSNSSNAAQVSMDMANTRIGIGTSSPSFPLHINSSSTDVAKFQTSGSYAYTRFQNSSKTWALSVGSDFSFYDEAASATRLTVDSSGNLLVGTTGTASAKTVINVSAAGTQAVLLLNNAHGYGVGTGVASTAIQFSRDTSPTNGQAVIGAQIHSGNEYETTSNPQNLVFSTKTGASGYALTEAMRINSSQQVVIGATAPYAGTKLDVRGGNIMVGGYGGGTDYGLILTPDDSSGYWNIANITSGHLTFNNSNTIGSSEKMRIDTNGRLLAGTATVGARNAHTFARTGSFAAEILQQQTSAGASVLGLTYDGAAPNNTTDYFIYARDTAGIKYRLHANGSSEQVGNITTNGQVISNHQITSDAGHNTARFEARYDDQNSTNPQYNGNMLMWVSEPGISYDSGGIGTNVHPSGHYYGRRYNYGYSTWMRFQKSDGAIQFGQNQGTSGTANASQTETLKILADGKLRLATTGGIGFGTTNAANLLDDYEEGNFAPSFSAAGGTAPSGQVGTGQYTKIGDVVHITGQITWTGAGSGGSNLRISIPFNLISDARAGMSIGLNSGVSYTSGYQLHLIPEINTNVIYLVDSPHTGAGHNHLNYSNVTSSGSKIFSFSGIFHTRD